MISKSNDASYSCNVRNADVRRPGDADLDALQRAWPAADFRPLLRDENRAVAIAHARAVRQQRVAILQMRIGVKGHGGDFVLAIKRGAVERLDVGQYLVDVDAVDLHGAARQPVEHERVIGVGTVGHGDFHCDSVSGGRWTRQLCQKRDIFSTAQLASQ